VMDGLFLGGADVLQDKEWFESNGITHSGA
jgi:hypothetical protein